MKCLSTSILLAGALSMGVASQLSANPDLYTDSANDIDPGIATAGGTLDILSLEITNNASDIVFKLTVNGSVNATDWGKFMIGMAQGGAAASNGNGWGRPINMDSPIGGMTRWIGWWVDGGGGAENLVFSGGSWSLAGATYNGNFGGFFAAAGNEMTYTMSLSSLGLNLGDTFYFDAYSSGGGGGDSAIDALANPNQSVSSWGDTYTSTGTNLFSYTVVPAPAALAVLGAFGLVRGRRSRKG
jgi:hypothetical protein